MNSKPNMKFAVLAIDVVAFCVMNGALMVRLMTITKHPQFEGKKALIGGLVLPEETAEDAVIRHMKNKADMHGFYFEQLFTFSALGRDPRGRVVSIGHIALVDGTSIAPEDRDHWHPVASLPKLAYDHNEIVETAVARLQARLSYTTIVMHMLPEEFTFSQLQKTYEVVLGQGIDKRNFRKKIMAADVLKDTGKTKKEGVMRPAAVYRFASRKISVVSMA